MSDMTMNAPAARGQGMSKDEKFVVFASSTGTVFEWYDFYLYATLAPFFAALFFPPGNDTAALLSAFATYAAGFLVRPFGALVFGRLGDMIGRKYTFLVTMMVMGIATFLVGLLPTFATIGWLAPVLLVGTTRGRSTSTVRCAQRPAPIASQASTPLNGACARCSWRPGGRSCSSIPRSTQHHSPKRSGRCRRSSSAIRRVFEVKRARMARTPEA